MADRIQLRRDTKANWEQYNPILLEGEPGHVLDDPNLYKMGDGVHAWNDLPYRGYNGTVVQNLDNPSDNSVPSGNAVTGYAYNLMSKDDCWLYNNHVESEYPSGQHNVVENNDYDSIIFFVKDKTGFLHIEGLSEQHTSSARFTAFNTDKKEDWNNAHFVGYNSVSTVKNGWVPILNGAVVYVLSLYKECYPNGYDSIKILNMNYDKELEESETRVINYGDILSPINIENGYEINSSGQNIANSSYRVCTYNIDNSKKYELTASIPGNYGSAVVHYYNGQNYIRASYVLGAISSHSEELVYENVQLDIPENCTVIKIVEASSRVYRLQDINNRISNFFLKKYLAEGLSVYPFSFVSYNGTTLKGNIADGYRDYHVVIINTDNVSAIMVENNIEVVRAIFSNQLWNNDGVYDLISAKTAHLKGIIEIPNGASYCILTISSTGLLDLNRLNIPIRKFYKEDTDKKDFLNKIIIPNKLTKGKIHRDDYAEIINSNSWNLFEYDNINPQKSYFVSAVFANTSTILVHYYDSNNNWLGHDFYNGGSLPRKEFDNVVLHIPANATKMYINVETGFEKLTRVREVGYEDTVNLKDKIIIEETQIIANKGLSTFTGDYFDSTGTYHYNIFEYHIDQTKDYVLTASLPNTSSVFAVYYDENGNYIADDIYYGQNLPVTELNHSLLHIPSNAAILRVNGYSSQPAPILQELGEFIDVSEIKGDVEVLKESGDAGLPLYYKDYIAGIDEKIQKAFLLSEPLSDAFTFITDVHYPRVNGSGFKIMRHLIDNTPIDKAICGGDLCGTNAAYEYGEGTEIIDALAMTGMMVNKDFSIVRESGKPMLTARGNHDYSLMKKSGTDGNSSWLSDWTSVRNIIMNNMEQYGFTANQNDNKACYFYKDYPARKLRYVYVDAADTNELYNNHNNSVVIGLTDTQIQWLIEQAVMTTPQDYDLVFVSHICPEAIAGGRETIDGQKKVSFKKLSDMLIAIQEKTVLTLTLNSVVKTYDLTSFNPDILLYKSGHLHREGIGWYGYWAYATGCEWAGGGNELAETKEYIHFGIDTSRNTQTAKGSIYESLVDAILINGRKNVLSFRIGAGVNRIFQQRQIVISSGSTITLESSLGNNVKWWCYDSQNYGDGQEWYQIVLKNDCAEINENTGVLTAKSLAGYSTVMAYDEGSNTIEYFGVKVVL